MTFTLLKSKARGLAIERSTCELMNPKMFSSPLKGRSRVLITIATSHTYIYKPFPDGRIAQDKRWKKKKKKHVYIHD